MPSLWERWRRERQRRMLRSVEALGKDKCPARSDQWASATPLGYRVLDSLELAAVIYGLTLYAVFPSFLQFSLTTASPLMTTT
jgi:hypothetical protein